MYWPLSTRSHGRQPAPVESVRHRIAGKPEDRRPGRGFRVDRNGRGQFPDGREFDPESAGQGVRVRLVRWRAAPNVAARCFPVPRRRAPFRWVPRCEWSPVPARIGAWVSSRARGRRKHGRAEIGVPGTPLPCDIAPMIHLPTAAVDSLSGLAFGDRWFGILRHEGPAAWEARILPPEPLWRFTVAGRGDIDTTCAIAGEVIAARTGVAALPLAWHAAREPLPPTPVGQRTAPGPGTAHRQYRSSATAPPTSLSKARPVRGAALRDAARPEGTPDAGECGRSTACSGRHCRTALW